MGKDSHKWLPPELVAHVTAGCGAPGEIWLTELPDMIRQLEELWSISALPPFPGIEYNFVAPAKNRNGEDVVLKIAPPWDPIEIFGEAEYLRSREGVACAKLIAEERDSKAILIERIFPGEALFVRFKNRPEDSVAPAIDVLRAILRPCSGSETHIATQDAWFDGLRKYSGTEFPADYAFKALKIYERLSGAPRGNYYLHGDYHPGNIVTAGSNSFAAIDPKGLVGHLGHEIAVFLNNLHWWQEKDPGVREKLDAAVLQFASAFDLSPQDLREWAFAQMVLGAWWNFSDMPLLYDGGVVKADIWDV